jgi:hypothetical protein
LHISCLIIHPTGSYLLIQQQMKLNHHLNSIHWYGSKTFFEIAFFSCRCKIKSLPIAEVFRNIKSKFGPPFNLFLKYLFAFFRWITKRITKSNLNLNSPAIYKFQCIEPELSIIWELVLRCILWCHQGTYVEGIKVEVVLSPAHALSLIASGEGTWLLLCMFGKSKYSLTRI